MAGEGKLDQSRPKKSSHSERSGASQSRLADEGTPPVAVPELGETAAEEGKVNSDAGDPIVPGEEAVSVEGSDDIEDSSPEESGSKSEADNCNTGKGTADTCNICEI